MNVTPRTEATWRRIAQTCLLLALVTGTYSIICLPVCLGYGLSWWFFIAGAAAVAMLVLTTFVIAGVMVIAKGDDNAAR